jgi:hypothetical protein
MTSQDDLSARVDSQFHLQRIPRTSDLLSLLPKSGQASSDSRPWQPFRRRSTNSGSENSDALYMVMSDKSNRLDCSLSLTSSNSAQKLDGPSDGKGPWKKAGAAEDAAEELSWDIIDREIYEWQYVCRIGHPYCWSPKAKYNRLNMVHPKLANEQTSRVWIGEADDRPKLGNCLRRRAVSDSFLADSNTVGDMAHMIAVQLLSSCFTLPPDLVTNIPSQSYAVPEKIRLPNMSLLDSRMISSLRMHTSYRYSPCFGHQARNTSPAHLWPSTYDGPFPKSSSPPTVTGMQTPDIGTSDILSRRRRLHRALHVTEGSATSCSLDSHMDDYLKLCSAKVNLDSTVRAEASTRWQGTEDDNKQEHTLPHILHKGKQTQQASTMDTTSQEHIDTSEVYRTRPKTNYDSNTTTSQHEFMQPVKELVARRWQTLRRRLGGSSHSNVPLTGSDEISVPSGSGASSPVVESDGKERRRRARASGDISSYESTPHYNSPVSSHLSPTQSRASSPAHADYGTVHPSSVLIESLAAAESLAFAKDCEDLSLSYDPAVSNPSPTSESCPGYQPQNASHLSLVSEANSQSRAKNGHGPQSLLNSNASGQLGSIRKSRRGQRRKSMLSEMFTAGDDIADETTTKGCNDETETSVSNAASRDLSPLGSKMESTSDMRPPDSDIAQSSITARKPRLSRTSTSGTQIFSPSDDGVEVDELPVGLNRNVCDGPGKRRARSYL